MLIEAIKALDDRAGEDNDAVAFDLGRLLTGREAAELTAARPDLEGLATAGHKPVTRQLGYLALIAADGGVDKAWTLASKSAGSLRDLVDAMPAIRDPGQRAALYPRVLPLLDGLPKALGGGTRASKGTEGRFVRIELRGRRTLTLAEVEVFSDGRNIAPLGKATQKNTAYGGAAERAIDGNKSGDYGDGGQTHTEENTSNPWWEVDLGAELPDRRRSPSGTGRTATSTSGSIAIPSRSSTRAATSSSRPPTCRPGGRRPRPRSAGPGRRDRSDARRWSR